MVEEVSNETANAEFAKEISSKDKYFIEPVIDEKLIKALKEAFKTQSMLSEKEPSNS
jgi:hypothetical protein